MPNLNDKDVCEYEFEYQNFSRRLWYTDLTMSLLRNLENSLYENLSITPEYWNLNIEYIENIIKEIKEEEIKVEFNRKYEDLMQLLKFRPFHK